MDQGEKPPKSRFWNGTATLQMNGFGGKTIAWTLSYRVSDFWGLQLGSKWVERNLEKVKIFLILWNLEASIFLDFIFAHLV